MSQDPRDSADDFALEEARDPRAGLTSNTITGYVKMGIQVLLILVLTPFLIDKLGVDEFGLWSLVWAVVSMFGLINLGFGAAVGKFIADARGRRDPEAYRSSLATLFWTHLVEMVLLFATVGVVTLLAGRVFSVPADQVPRTQQLLLILGVATAVQLPLSVFRGVFAGHQEWTVTNAYEILGSVLYCGVTLIVLPLSPNVVTLALINGVSLTLAMVFTTAHAFKRFPGVSRSLHPRYASWRKLREIWGVSAFFAIIAVAGIISTRVDTVIIDRWLDLRAIAIYAVAARISQYVVGFGVQLAQTLSPVVAELHGGDDEKALREVWVDGSKFAVAIAAPCVLVLAVLARPFIEAWLGPELAPAAFILQILLCASLITIIHSNSQNYLAMRGEQAALAGGVMGGEVLNVVLSIALITAFGLTGVAAATLVVAVVVNAGFVMQRVTKQQRSTRWFFYKKVLVPSVVPLAGSALALVGLMTVYPLTNLIEVGVAGGLGVVVFWGLYWPLGMNAAERRSVMERVGRRFARRRPNA